LGAAGRRGAATDADRRRAVLLVGRSETPSRTWLGPTVAATDDDLPLAGDGSQDGPAGAPGAGGPTRREGPDTTAGRGAIVAHAVAPAAEPVPAAAVAINAAGGAGVQRPVFAALEDARPAAAGRLPRPTVAGGVAHDCESGANESLSESPSSPPKDASVRAASRAVARASVGDVSMSPALLLLRAARAARRSSILWARSAGVGGFIV